MRVAQLIGVFPKLSETFILNQLSGLLDRGVEVDIFGMAVGDLSTLHPTVTRYRLLERSRYLSVPKNRAARLFKAGRQFLKPYAWHPGALDALNARKHGREAFNLERLYTVLSFLKEKPYDILHCQFGALGLIGLELKRQGVFRGKLVTSFRGADLTSSLRERPGLYRELVREGDLFLPVSDLFKAKLLAEGCEEAKIRVLRSGIDLTRFAFKPRGRGESEATRLLFIGRLEPKKGVLFAALAVAEVLKQGRRLEFDIVGDGLLRQPLEAFIRSQGVGAQVRLHGAQSQERVLEHLEQAHLLIAPSITSPSGDQEGIPNTLKEGMAVGLPVLSTFHSGIPELVEDGVSGYLAPENDVAALSEKLLRLVDEPERWAAMGRAGRAKVEADYDLERLNDELVRLYAGLVEATPSPREVSLNR